MGISLKNIGKKLLDQINPLDNGKTWSNPVGNAPAQRAANVAAPSAAHQLFHNGVTNAGGGLVKGGINWGVAGGKSVYDIARGSAAAATNNELALANAHKAKVTDFPAFLSPLTRPVVQTVESIAHPLSQHSVTPKTANEKEILGSAPIQNINKGVNSTFQTRKDLPLPQRILTAGAYGVGQVGQDVATLAGAKSSVEGTAANAAKVTAKTAKKTVVAAKALDANQAGTLGEKVPVTPPKTVVKPKSTGVAPIDEAVKNMVDHYNTPASRVVGIESVVNTTKGTASAGQLLAGRLGTTIRKHLTPEEDAAVYDKLQGVKNSDLTPRAAKVVEALRPLYKKGLDIRQEINPDVNEVGNYAPRILRSTVANAIRTTKGGAAAKIKSILNLGDLESGFSKSRQYGKFVDKKGNAIFGKAGELGLTHHKDGTISNGKSGGAKVTYKQVSTNTKELQDNLGVEYLSKSSHVSSLYHADTARLQAKAAAIQELNSNPLKHGLLTKEQAQSGAYGGSFKEINVPQLKDANGENYYAKPTDAKLLERDRLFGHPDVRSLPGKVYDAFSNVATQFIVLNPVFHGANQLVQSAIAAGNISGNGGGWIRLSKGVFTVKDADTVAYLRDGGHVPDYGSQLKNVVSRATGGATKVPSKMMAAIELKLRVGLYKASVEGGMESKAAVKNIDKFLGDQKQLSRATQRVTLFAHYFKTVGGALYSQVRHPEENFGATVNTALVAGVIVGMTQQYQEFTGNPNAYVRVPGELGLAKELVKTAGEVKSGEVPTILTNHINPVAKEIGQQLTNHDLFTDKPVGNTVKERAQHAGSSLIAPSQVVAYGASGKRSPAEIAANQLQLNTPHAKGAPAAPNLPFLNTKGSKVVKGKDPTGHQQQTTYFATTKDARKGLSDTDAKLYDELTAATSKLNDKQIQGHYQQLFSNPKVAAAITKQKQEYSAKTGTPLDPLYSDNVTPEQRAEYFHMQALPYKGDDYLQQKDANTQWMQQLTTARSDYFKKVDFAGATKSDRVQPPAFSKSTQSNLDAAGGLVGAEKAQFIADHPDVEKAYESIAKYTNDKRVAQGNAPFKPYPKADAQTAQILKDYNALPQHDGKKGGNATRARWITAHPEAYAKIQDYYTKTSEYQLANNAGADKYAGSDLSQAALKAAYSLGKYDIAVTTNADGTKSYSLDPAAASVANAASSSYSSGSSRTKAIKYLGNSAKFRVTAPSGKIKKVKVSLKKGTSGGRKFSIKSVKPKKQGKVKFKV